MPLRTAGGAVDVSLTLWVLTIAGLAALIAVDFFIGRKPHDVSIKEAGIWTVVWIVLAALFGLGLLVFGGGQPAGEFFAGFITEKSLSVDNLFVFVLIMAKFAVPSQYQQRVLLIGVLIALVLRAIFIAAGAAILASFAWVFYIFGAFLIYTAGKLVFTDNDHVDPSQSRFLKIATRIVPSTDQLDGQKLFTVENGRRLATPLFSVLLLVEATDVVFAVDSVPAVLAVSHEQFIVFASNAFAIMGLRALYFLIADMKDRFAYLQEGLAIILAFVGVKMLVHEWYHIPTWLSLTVIAIVLTSAIGFSLKAERIEAAAGIAHGQDPVDSEHGDR
jgi:tellurite resistance protein TerC